MSVRDPIWLNFPRWIEESGIPEQVLKDVGVEGWLVFRKLIEIDCDTNLTPAWFSFHPEDIARFTGISQPLIEPLLARLEQQKWIERRNIGSPLQEAVIGTPFPVEVDEQALKNQLQKHGISSRLICRYLQDTSHLDKTQTVLYFYQMLFGARFSPRIVEDLEEISACYPMDVIYQVFQEAFQKRAKTLAWIKSHLPDTIQSNEDGQRE